MDGKRLYFDVWLNGNWVGMAEGESPAEAREMLKNSFIDDRLKQNTIMLPFYGCGTSQATYKALMGIDSNN